MPDSVRRTLSDLVNLIIETQMVAEFDAGCGGEGPIWGALVVLGNSKEEATNIVNEATGWEDDEDVDWDTLMDDFEGAA